MNQTIKTLIYGKTIRVKKIKAIIEKLEEETNHNELSHIELKENNTDPNLIGRTISAIANTCIRENLNEGFLIFGISNDLEHIGTNFDPFNLKRGNSNQDLEIWLRQMTLGVDFLFMPLKHEGKDFLIIKISKALGRIATFQKKAYIRIGKNTSELNQYPDIEKDIWSKIDKNAFWKMPARSNLTSEEILQLLDHGCYYRLIKLPQPSTPEKVLDRFEEEYFIIKEHETWSITNLGALVLANDMNSFPGLKYKTPRVITYEGDNKLSPVIKDYEGSKGYACGFEPLRNWIDSQIPEPQEITKIFRKQKKYYPAKTLREIVANALIHQDCEAVGMRPIIEIYKNHIEISNPGNCLVDPNRILGAIPRARNELLVDVMKRLYICETRGSGIPRAISKIEKWQLPAPTFVNQENGFKVSIYSYKPFNKLDNEEKLRICEQHVTFMYTQGEFANNETLRKRFGVGEAKTNIISKLVKTAKDNKSIKDFDPKSTSRKYVKYVPFWA